MKKRLIFGLAFLALAALLIAQVPGKHFGFAENRYWANSGVLRTDSRLESLGTSNGLRLYYSESVYTTLATDSSGYLALTAGVFKHAYDAAAYYTITQADAGGVTLNGVSDGTASFTFSDPVNLSAIMTFSGTPQTLTGAGAVNITTAITWLVTTGTDALTLADGAEGQVKIIVVKTDGGAGTLTPAHPAGFATLAFGDVGDSVWLVFTNGAWHLIGNNGATVG